MTIDANSDSIIPAVGRETPVAASGYAAGLRWPRILSSLIFPSARPGRSVPGCPGRQTLPSSCAGDTSRRNRTAANGAHRHLFRSEQFSQRRFTRARWLVIFAVGVLIYLGVRLALRAPTAVPGPDISLSPAALPVYALFSIARMLTAYALSFLFTLVYGYAAAYNRRAEAVLMPLLDVLQSVPILSFLPVVLLGLSAILPQGIAAELASIVLIFTSQAWNMTFAWYQSLTTVPEELREASSIFRFNRWLRLKTLELPFGANSLIWNSMMSWAGGWFFLMAAEIFTVGARDFRLPGLGAYLSEAAAQGRQAGHPAGRRHAGGGHRGPGPVRLAAPARLVRAVQVATMERENPPTSWFYDLLRNSRLVEWLSTAGLAAAERAARRLAEPPAAAVRYAAARKRAPLCLDYVVLVVLAGGLLVGAYFAAGMLLAVSLAEWAQVALGVLATLRAGDCRAGHRFGLDHPGGRAHRHQRTPGALVAAGGAGHRLDPGHGALPCRGAGPGRHCGRRVGLAAVLLMLLGTQWYLLFNVIAGASAIPQDLKYTTALLGLGRTGALAHDDPARALSVSCHRRDHRQRRRLERQHRRGIHPLRRPQTTPPSGSAARSPRPRPRATIRCCWPPR